MSNNFKKVVLPVFSVRDVMVNDVNDDFFYGVVHPTNESRSFIMRKEYDIGDCWSIPYFYAGLTNGNGFSYYGDTLKDVLTTLISEHWGVYEFNVMSDLLRWLVEDSED